MMYGFGNAYGAGPGFLGGGWLIMGFGMLAAIGLLVWLVYAVIKRETSHTAVSQPPVAPAPPTAAPAPDAALAIVRERYARGEIDADQYAKLVEDLGGK